MKSIYALFKDEKIALPRVSPNGTFIDNLQEAYNEYLYLLETFDCYYGKDVLSYIVDKLDNIRIIGNTIISVIDSYLKGDYISAFNEFNKFISDLHYHIKPRPEYLNNIKEEQPGQEKMPLYKMRISNNSEEIDKWEHLFHIPFEKRELAASYRYSFPGLPCLYLGSSIYCCWEELNRPELNKVIVSKYVFQNTPRILDISTRPSDIGILEEATQWNPSPRTPFESELFEFMKEYLVCWPLIAACSFIPRKRATTFIPEYIIPQLLLQWIIHSKKYDGIAYFSCKKDWTHFGVWGFTVNYAFPVKSYKNEGYCNELKKLFKISNPISMFDYFICKQAISKELNKKAITFKQYDINLRRISINNGDAYVTYYNTELGMFEKYMIHMINSEVW